MKVFYSDAIGCDKKAEAYSRIISHECRLKFERILWPVALSPPVRPVICLKLMWVRFEVQALVYRKRLLWTKETCLILYDLTLNMRCSSRHSQICTAGMKRVLELFWCKHTQAFCPVLLLRSMICVFISSSMNNPVFFFSRYRSHLFFLCISKTNNSFSFSISGCHFSLTLGVRVTALTAHLKMLVSLI